MNTITHDPTRGWLLLTEKWPEKPLLSTAGNQSYLNGNEWYKQTGGYRDPQLWYNEAVAHCLSTAIEIAKEDWDAVKKLVLADVVGKCYVSPCEAIGEYPCGNCKAIVNGIIKEGGRGHIEDHHPYKVDAEFEVVIVPFIGAIARLVKAKEVDYYLRELGRIIDKYKAPIVWNKPKPTDSVTSDGTTVDPSKVIVKPPVMIYEHKSKPEPTETQDEMWDEIVRDCTDPDGFLDIDLARKSFRIERI